MDDAKLNEIVESVVRQLIAAGAVSGTQPAGAVVPFPQQNAGQVNQPAPAPAPVTPPPPTSNLSPRTSTLTIDLPDPTTDDLRYKPRVKNPLDPAARL